MGMDDFSDLSMNDAITPFDRAASHPNPAFDFLTGFAPRKLKDLFRWCDYLFYNSAHIFAALKKFGDLIVTNIEYGTSNTALRKNYKHLYEKKLKMKSIALQASLDKHVYGNHFTSIYFPFVRFLKCPKCTQMINIAAVDYKFDLKRFEFRYLCKRCRNTVNGEIVDKKITSLDRIHVIRWDPKLMDIEYNPFTGQSIYYYNIPTEFKEKVKQGAKHLINTTPRELLENVRDNKLFRFEKDAIFHLKVPAPSGIDQQWGFPPLAATLKLFLFTMVLKKANESIALDHITPFRILHPAQNGAQDFAQQISLTKWQNAMKSNIRKWRRDPLHLMFAPIPVGVVNMGGDGRAMLTLGEVQEAEKSIMAALGVPPEFLFGGLTRTGMDATLRIIENQLQGDSDDLNDLVQWVSDKIAKYLGWERIDVNFTPLTLVDDTEMKQLIMQLAMPQQSGAPAVVSLTTAADRLGIDLAEERELRREEAMAEARLQLDIKRDTDKLQNTLSQQVQAAQQGQQGLQYDPQAVIQAAEQKVQELSMMDEGSRKSALSDLQNTDYVLYAVVIQRLEQQNNMQRVQAEQAIKQQGGQQPTQ